MQEGTRRRLQAHTVPLIDLHADILTDVTLRREHGQRQVIATRHLPALEAGGVAAVVAAIWAESSVATGEERALARRQLGALEAELAETPGLWLVRSPAELDAARQAGRLGVILAAAGLAFLEGDPERLDSWHAAGLRLASLTWNGDNGLAAGQGAGDGGVSPSGRQVLRRMAELGIVLDVSHLSEVAFWEALDAYPGVVVASHSNARALCDHPRNLTDDQIRALASRGGLVGLNSYPRFVDPKAPSLERYLDHVAYLVDRVGVECVAFGFDFTSYLPPAVLVPLGDPEGLRSLPGLAGPQDVPAVLEGLRRRGFTEEEILALAWDNWLRVWGQVAPAPSPASSGREALEAHSDRGGRT